jgi:hypothetical protein
MNVLAGSRALEVPLVVCAAGAEVGSILMIEPRWDAGRFVELMTRGQGRVAPFHRMKRQLHSWTMLTIINRTAVR